LNETQDIIEIIANSKVELDNAIIQNNQSHVESLYIKFHKNYIMYIDRLIAINTELSSVQEKFQKLHYNILPYIKEQDKRLSFQNKYDTLIAYYSLSTENLNVLIKDINAFNNALIVYNKQGRKDFLKTSLNNYLLQEAELKKSQNNIKEINEVITKFVKFHNKMKNTLHNLLF